MTPPENAARYPKPPLGRVPVLPPTHICRDHDGDRFSGKPCPNCVPIYSRPGIAYEPCPQGGHAHDWRDCPTPEGLAP